jgi:hypothetical protein
VSRRVRDGVIESISDARRWCLWTPGEYEHFDLEFDWKVGVAGNPV